MDVLIEREKHAIFSVFNNAGGNYWKTLFEIAAEAQVNLEDVITIIYSSGDFVASGHRTEEGLPLYTTRKVYRERTPFFRKLLSAFQNTIN